MGGVEMVTYFSVPLIVPFIAAGAVVISAAYAFYVHRKQKKFYELMEKMIDSAINNEFYAEKYDETRLSRLEQKLERFILLAKANSTNITEERDKIKSLISDISHQTKTPVSNILLYSQLLKSRSLPDKKTQLMIDEIISQSEKLIFLIQSLVKISRLETGIIHASPKRNSLFDMLLSVVNDIEAYAKSKNISITIQCDKDIFAQFDPKWTREAIYNIIDNSIKYTGKDGAVKISVAKYEFFCRIDISDTGIGINEDEYSKIFMRFYRSPSVSQYEGVGIGLHISREIIMAQGGYIKVISIEKKGTTFSVFLQYETRF